MCLLVCGIFAHCLHKGRITILIGTRLLALASMFQVETITTAPFPRVIQIKHCNHLAFPHFLKKEIKTSQNRIVIFAWSHLKCRLHLCGDTTLTIGTHEHTEIINSHFLHQVEFLAQTFTVSTLSFRAENSAIPEIRSYIIVRFPFTHKMPILNLNE